MSERLQETRPPWEAKGPQTGGPACVRIHAVHGKGRRVAEVTGPNAQAIANLIVRAGNCHEELVEACGRLLSAIRPKAKKGHLRLTPGDEQDVAFARAAIAKAKGE